MVNEENNSRDASRLIQIFFELFLSLSPFWLRIFLIWFLIVWLIRHWQHNIFLMYYYLSLLCVYINSYSYYKDKNMSPLDLCVPGLSVGLTCLPILSSPDIRKMSLSLITVDGEKSYFSITLFLYLGFVSFNNSTYNWPYLFLYLPFIDITIVVIYIYILSCWYSALALTRPILKGETHKAYYQWCSWYKH